jgi:hypothetical protein
MLSIIDTITIMESKILKGSLAYWRIPFAIKSRIISIPKIIVNIKFIDSFNDISLLEIGYRSRARIIVFAKIRKVVKTKKTGDCNVFIKDF